MPLKLADLLTKEPPKPDWLIEKLVHRQQFVVAAGEAGVGKSFFWYTAAYAVALGKHFLVTRQCSPGSVLYFDDENSLPELIDYLLKIWWAYGCPDPVLLAERLHIEHFQLSRVADAWPAYMSKCIAAVKPSLVIVDTAASAFTIQDENDNAEASRAIKLLRSCMLVGRPDASLVILKHAKDGRVRGAKVWEGMVDQVLVHANFQGGKKRADGYRNTRLLVQKVRSFGLRVPLRIIPVNGGSSLGLKSEVLQVKANKRVTNTD